MYREQYICIQTVGELIDSNRLKLVLLSYKIRSCVPRQNMTQKSTGAGIFSKYLLPAPAHNLPNGAEAMAG
jgi:hypothetical protein